MKLTPIVAVIAMALPTTAGAQSIHETHKLHFYPAGKTPSSTWVPRAKAACHDRADADRGASDKARCKTAAKKAPATPALAN